MGNYTYLPYLTFGANTVSLIGQIISITLMSYLIYCSYFNKSRIRVKSLSRSMLIYLFTDVIASSIGLFDGFYMVIGWSPDSKNFNMHLVFWNGICLLNYLTVSQVPILFLTLDRCVAIRFGYQKNERIRMQISYVSIFVIIIVYSYSLMFYLLELPIPDERFKKCKFFSCLIVKYQNVPQLATRFIFATMNLICTIYFIYLLREKQIINAKNSTNKNIKDRVVKLTIVYEILFAIFPTFFGTFLTIVIGEPSSNYLGPNSVYVTVQAALSSITYLFILLKKPFENKSSAVLKLNLEKKFLQFQNLTEKNTKMLTDKKSIFNRKDQILN